MAPGDFPVGDVVGLFDGRLVTDEVLAGEGGVPLARFDGVVFS